MKKLAILRAGVCIFTDCS